RHVSTIPAPPGTFTRHALVVDGILAIEVDGRTHDERRRTLQDRAKEADIRAAGYQVVRYSYQQIMHNWPGVYADILRMLTAE
ncbi:MAG: endonuclease domain-containing protein, partial [Pseudoclavibacter sp.]